MSKADKESPVSGADNIISHINNAHGNGVERSREVIVRPDGSKVIRVKKRRKVYRDSDEKRQLGNKNFLMMICASVLVIIVAAVGLYLFRLSSFNQDSFAEQMKQELAQAWGGEVEISNFSVDGREISASSIKIRFPENTCLSFVTLDQIKAEISMAGLFMGQVKGEGLNVGHARIGLRPGYATFAIPTETAALPFRFKRYTAPRFEIGYAHETEPYVLERAKSSFYLSAEAYIRANVSKKNREYVLDLSNQKLKIKGWPDMVMNASSVIIDSEGIKQISMSGVLDKGRLMANSTDAVPFQISGAMRYNTSLQHKAWTLSGRNFNLEQILGNTFTSFLKVRMGGIEGESTHEMNLAFGLPVDATMNRPSVSGTSGTVSRVVLSRLPVMNLLNAMTSRQGGENFVSYTSPVLTGGAFVIETDGTDMNASLKNISLTEQGLLSVLGNLYARGDKLSGSLELKLPSYAVNVMPQAARQEGNEVIVKVNVSGSPQYPTDNSAAMLKEVRDKVSGKHLKSISAPNSTNSKVTVDGFM